MYFFYAITISSKRNWQRFAKLFLIVSTFRTFFMFSRIFQLDFRVKIFDLSHLASIAQLSSFRFQREINFTQIHPTWGRVEWKHQEEKHIRGKAKKLDFAAWFNDCSNKTGGKNALRKREEMNKTSLKKLLHGGTKLKTEHWNEKLKMEWNKTESWDKFNPKLKKAGKFEKLLCCSWENT